MSKTYQYTEKHSVHGNPIPGFYYNQIGLDGRISTIRPTGEQQWFRGNGKEAHI